VRACAPGLFLPGDTAMLYEASTPPLPPGPIAKCLRINHLQNGACKFRQIKDFKSFRIIIPTDTVIPHASPRFTFQITSAVANRA